MLKGGTLVADMLVRQRGLRRARRVPLVVEDGGRIVSRDSITLPADGDVAPVRISVAAQRSRARGRSPSAFRTQPGEQVDAEQRAAGARRRARRPGARFCTSKASRAPRCGSFARAVEADSNLQLVTLQRTAENKFLPLERRQRRRARDRLSRRPAPSCSAIARSSSATWKRASSRTTSSRCSPTS